MTSLKQQHSDPDSIMFSARALQELVRSFGNRADPTSNPFLFQGQFIAAPVLLALAMELALKAWWAKENTDCEVPKTHNLLKLFDRLNEDTQARLESAYPEIPHDLRGFHPFVRDCDRFWIPTVPRSSTGDTCTSFALSVFKTGSSAKRCRR